ncbi:MAG TPA: hypothetical protein VH089_25930 [Streptosporangiaceae bacterium]|jgi:hypothetical protein|nr:hypothetical protein [Streptosporangiaceae bacterium]
MPENPYAISYGRHAATTPAAANHALPPTAAPNAAAPNSVAPPYSHGRRIFYGLVWAGWTALLTIAGFAALFGGQVLVGLFALAAAGVAGHYDYRIWTWQARRLLFLIIW